MVKIILQYFISRYELKILEIDSKVKHLNEAIATNKLQWWAEESHIREISKLMTERDLLVYKLNKHHKRYNGDK